MKNVIILLLLLHIVCYSQQDKTSLPMKKIIVTTGDLKEKYEILGIISFLYNENRKPQPEEGVAILDFIMTKLQEEAIKKGGNAIIFVRIEHTYSGMANSEIYYAYGTVVKKMAE